MRKWCLACLIVSGCSTTPTTVTQNVYPNLPDVPAVPSLVLQPVQVELPSTKNFVGLDYQNWSNLQINLQAIKQQLLEYQQRIAEINKQRADWRSNNSK